MGALSKSPIFIGGDGRSGTTLLAVMLDSHSDLVILPELHFTGPTDLGPSVVRVLEMMAEKDWRVTTPGYQQHPEFKDPVQFVRRCERAGVSHEVLRVEVLTTMAECGSDLSSFVDRCNLVGRLGRQRASEEGKTQWGLKIMKEIARADRYAEMWEGAGFVHVVRDGRDVAASQILDHNWGYSIVDEAIDGWCMLLESVGGHGDLIWSIRYEDIVKEPGIWLGRLFEWLGLAWEDNVLRYYEMEHSLTNSRVRHPSRDALMSPLKKEGIQRFVRDLPTPWVRKFSLEAEGTLRGWGYEPLPEVKVAFSMGREGCQEFKVCAKRIQQAKERLGGRYLGEDKSSVDQVRAAWLNVEGVNYEEFFQRLKKFSKGVQEFRRAEREGVEYRLFDRRTFLPDIVEVNNSKEYRSAGKMRESYRKSVEEMGGYPKKFWSASRPECPRHNDLWWGAFLPWSGYKQGDVQTDEKLVGYVNLRSYGDFAFYNLILGHGEYMKWGVVMGLHLAIMKWIMHPLDDVGSGLRTVVYAGYFQGSEGLEGWKKKAGFAPGYLAVRDNSKGMD